MLSLFATIINRLGERMEAEVPRIFEAVFECTLQMITRNFEVGTGCVCIQFFNYFFSRWGRCRASLRRCWECMLPMITPQLRGGWGLCLYLGFFNYIFFRWGRCRASLRRCWECTLRLITRTSRWAWMIQ